MINEAFASAMQEAGYNLQSAMRGIKSVNIVMHNDCDICHGSGSSHRQRLMPIEPSMQIEPEPQFEPVECFKCKGSGGIEAVINLTVTKEPIKKEKAKK